MHRFPIVSLQQTHKFARATQMLIMLIYGNQVVRNNVGVYVRNQATQTMLPLWGWAHPLLPLSVFSIDPGSFAMAGDNPKDVQAALSEEELDGNRATARDRVKAWSKTH